MAGLPPFISFSISYPELASAVRVAFQRLLVRMAHWCVFGVVIFALALFCALLRLDQSAYRFADVTLTIVVSTGDSALGARTETPKTLPLQARLPSAHLISTSRRSQIQADREASPDQTGDRPRDFVRPGQAIARDASHGQDTGNVAARLRPARASALTASFASYADQLLSHTEIVNCGPERHSDLSKVESS
jgi:hypothetical protein